jgi:transposase
LSRGDLTEAEWHILKGLLPIERENRGRGTPPEQNRSIINGILWRLRCGAPWRDVPPKYGSWNTIYRRFRRWSEAGVWIGVEADPRLKSAQIFENVLKGGRLTGSRSAFTKTPPLVISRCITLA